MVGYGLNQFRPANQVTHTNLYLNNVYDIN